MHILIIGGLLGLAVLALLGAILLGLGEDRAEKAKKGLQAQASEAQASPAQPELPQPAANQGNGNQSALTYQSVPATPILSRSTIMLPVSNTGEMAIKTLNAVELNGQTRQITGELRALAQRAGEIQQRLTGLSETLESQEFSRAEPSHGGVPDLFSADTQTRVL